MVGRYDFVGTPSRVGCSMREAEGRVAVADSQVAMSFDCGVGGVVNVEVSVVSLCSAATHRMLVDHEDALVDSGTGLEAAGP